MSADPEKWTEILKAEIEDIHKRTGYLKRDIYERLGFAMGKVGGDSVRKWISNQQVPAKHTDLEKLAQALVDEGGLQDGLFEEFIVTGGHPNPAAVLGSTPIIDPLPRDPYFAGRDPQLNELLARIEPGQVIGLIGTGGVGKTTLIAELIVRLTPKDKQTPTFADGIFYYEFYKRPSVDVALEAIARRFGKDEAPANPQAAARRYLQGKQALLILDGAEEADNLDALLQIRQDCGVLIASRRELGVYMNYMLHLDTLPMPEAVKVLMDWSTRQRDEETEIYEVWTGQQQADMRLAEQICELLGRLPLALRLAGDNLGGFFDDAQTFLETLQGAPFALLEAEQRQHQSVPFLLRAMISRLDEAERQALAVVGVLSYEAFSVQVMATALAMPEFQARASLIKLTKSSLLRLVQRIEGRYQVVHRLIHTYVADPAHGLTVSDAVIARLAHHCIAFANIESELGTAGYAALDKERHHLLAMLEACQARRRWAETVSLATGMSEYLYVRGHWTDRLAALKIGLSAAQKGNLKQAEATILDALGTAYSTIGKPTQAIEHYNQALDLQRELDNQFAESLLLSSLGAVYVEVGQLESAIPCFQAAIDLARQMGDQATVAEELNNLGMAYEQQGEFEEAIDCYEQSLIIARESEDGYAAGIALINLGRSFASLGWHQQATESFQQALILAHETGGRVDEGGQLANIGNVYLELEQSEEALAYFERALTIAQEIGDQAYEVQLLGDIGNVLYDLDRMEEAVVYYERSLELAQTVGDLHAEASNLANLGLAYAALDQTERAKDLCRQAIAIFEEIGSPNVEMAREILAGIETAEEE